ncbi:NADPH-dependent FMN reductase [Pseudooceanicola sp.]|jgi:chromate reductase|uniref:NADPH-dependent FMN reductase n=1 Tax=Pseudooceanicola sp. TaxID=1914328 RepID=UPI00405A3611
MPDLLIIPGSLRAASSSRATARTIAARLGDRARCTIAEIGKLPHYNADVKDDPEVARFIEQVDTADGIVFVTPEYNYSVPGVLKNAIDWASRPAYASVFKGKPCLIVTTSGGVMGGVRAQAHLKYILNGMLSVVHPGKEIIVTQANTKVKDGKLEDEAVLGFIDEEMTGFLASLG